MEIRALRTDTAGVTNTPETVADQIVYKIDATKDFDITFDTSREYANGYRLEYKISDDFAGTATLTMFEGNFKDGSDFDTQPIVESDGTTPLSVSVTESGIIINRRVVKGFHKIVWDGSPSVTAGTVIFTLGA